MQYTSNVCNQILFKQTGSKSNLMSKLSKLKKIVGTNCFSSQYIKIFFHYKKISFNINALQQLACLVVNPITVGSFTFLFNCTSEDSMTVPT